MARKVQDIEGIGPAFQEKLNNAGVLTVEDLLARAGARAGRQALAEATGIDGARILTWVNHADLMRITGVGPQYAELLEASGVDSVPELARRNAENLSAKMEEVMTEKGITRASPAPKMVANWVAQAQTLPPAVTH